MDAEQLVSLVRRGAVKGTKLDAAGKRWGYNTIINVNIVFCTLVSLWKRRRKPCSVAMAEQATHPSSVITSSPFPPLFTSINDAALPTSHIQSLCGSLVMILSFIISSKLRKIRHRLILGLAINDLIQSLTVRLDLGILPRHDVAPAVASRHSVEQCIRSVLY